MIKRLACALAVVLLTACGTTVPVKVKFPDAPERGGSMAMKTCPDLKQLEPDPALSDVSRTINQNYSTYYECAVKVETWIEWYNIQKQIFDQALR